MISLFILERQKLGPGDGFSKLVEVWKAVSSALNDAFKIYPGVAYAIKAVKYRLGEPTEKGGKLYSNHKAGLHVRRGDLYSFYKSLNSPRKIFWAIFFF